MSTYEFSIEKKYTVWHRGAVSIEAESLDEAIHKVQELGYDGIVSDAENWYEIDDSTTALDVSENNGYATEEIRCYDTDEIIWNNTEGAQS